ncbi:MAG: pentapeptide repeat-containing protein [Scytonematopsis contorta HA4267-MV1]|nr:pentapeptide repeat-containing protein [Scytonematopsis contorta HA4267-MV1]
MNQSPNSTNPGLSSPKLSSEVNSENSQQPITTGTVTGTGNVNPPVSNQPIYSQIPTQQIQAPQTVSQTLPQTGTTIQPQQRQGLLFVLAAVLTGTTLLLGVGVYTLLKTVDSTTVDNAKTPQQKQVTQNDISSEAPVETLAPPTSTELSPQQTATESLTQQDSQVVAKPRTQKYQPEKNLGGVNWRARDLRGMSLRNVDLGGANLETANLSGVDLSGAKLGGANLAKANLRNANLSGADLRGANLGNANLTGANLNRTLLDGANLNGTKMP